MLQASQYPLDPFPLLTWFYQDHHHGGNSQKTSRESRGLLCAAASFIFFFCFSHPHRKYGEWEKNTKTTTLNTQHFRVLLSASTRPTRPQPFSNCTIMPYANNSYFLDKPVDPHALCKPPKKCTTKPTLKSKSKKNSLNRMRAAVDS